MSILTILALLAAALVHALPATNVSAPLPGRADLEWTAWGDSYASGVGSGKYTGGRRCLRYDSAYPVDVSKDSSVGGRLNNVVCSGAKADEVNEYQFYTSSTWVGHPNWQFYPRPSSGKPSVGTLSVGGDDIDFPGILSNCILEGFPWPLSSGFTARTCDQQRALTWSLICQDGDYNTPSADLIKKVDSVIQKAVSFGQGASGTGFRLYVTGYGQFFNDQDPGCDTVTFARTANPNDDHKTHNKMTTELRADFNAMSRTLNAAIQQAVRQNAIHNVKYIDIDGMLTGHRFCEAGVQEPDQERADTWFFHYPYKENNDANDSGIAYLNQVAEANANSLSWDPEKTLWVDYMNAFWDKVDENGLNQALGDPAPSVDTAKRQIGDVPPADDNAVYNFWSNTIGTRARMFHPQVAFHAAISSAILQQYEADTAPVSTAATVETS